MPEEVRRLRAPWPPLAREVPHLTPELEREFRFGQRVALTERGFLIGGTIKGGSSSMWIPGTADQFEAFLRWKQIDGFIEDGDPSDFEDLEALLREHDIELMNGRAHQMNMGDPHEFRRELGSVYPILLGILRELPPSHLAREELERIQVGGWGPDAAKGSAYQDGTVFLYDFAVRGARRTLIGLFLHELGHAHDHTIQGHDRDELRECYSRLVRYESLFGIEYLLDAASRRAYQRMAFEEFVAETYLAYTACGGALRAFIDGREPTAKDAWRAAYDIYRLGFEGVEYE
jgi:hypothetical protein